MVGFKTFWIAISALFLLGACVPQTKQSSCGTNEAFNSQLRTCVPIVGGAESFVTVKDFVPSSVISKSKDDYVDTTLSITVANPYNQTYTIQWERIFNGATVPLTPSVSSGLSVKINPGQLGTLLGQIGTHIVTAKIFVGTKQVDSHNFTVQINQSPKPTITSLTVNPDPGAGVTFTPADGLQTFNFTVKNNIGLDPLHNWSTRWTVVKNNVTYATEVDSFTNFGAADSNFPSLDFNPSVAGIGSYTVRAIVANNPPAPFVAEVVDERLWIVTVKHPDIGKVIAAHTPLTSTQTVAFHGVSYDVWGFRTAVSSASTKGQYCVQVDKPEGAYTDGSAQDPMNYGVVVRYYKDGGSSPIFEGFTTSSPLKSTVCFSEASAAEQANLFYNDGSATTPYYKTLKARVFDVQTGLEMCVDGTTCPVTYPVSWSVLVRPTNTPPTARILASAGAGDLIAYSSTPTSTTTTASATVQQDQNFTVRFSIADLAGEYDTALDLDKFRYTAVLKRGSTTITGTGCNKEFSDVDPTMNAVPQDNVGPVYECQFNIASSDVAGPLPPTAHTLTIQAEDASSPTPGSTGSLANLLTWNLTVTESNTAPTVALTNILVGGVVTPTPSEGQTITFQMAITDAEKDQYNLTFYKCSEATCTATLTSFTGNSSTLSYGSAHYNNNRTISYYIPEDEIGNVASGTIYFKAVVTDIPNTSLLSMGSSVIVPVTINQTNYAPVINTAALTSPAVNNVTAYGVFSGNRFSISTSGAVTDASNPATNEATLSYKWWIKPQASSTWTAIDGATNADGTLKWTPGPELSGLHHITFCVTDGSYLRPDVDPSIPGSICSSQYYLVDARTNLATVGTGASVNSTLAVHHVPSENLSYVAWASSTSISVAKVTYSASGSLNNSGMRVVSFAPNSAATTNSVKNLSLTASGDSLYVSYLADTVPLMGSFYAHIRRINISNTSGTKTAAAYSASPRKFDFTYSPITVTSTCTGGNCAYNSTTRQITFNGAGLNDATDNIVINPNNGAGSVTFPVSAGTTIVAGSICGGCNANSQAASLVDAINSYATTNNLQGLTATSSGGVVTLAGLETTNTAWVSSTTISALGKIVYSTANSKWYIPVINPALNGANQNKIQIVSGDEGNLSSSVDDGVLPLTLEAATVVDNGLSASGNMVLAYVTQSGAVAKVIQLDNSFLASTTPLTLFSGYAITDIKVRPSPGTSNPNVFALAKNVSGNYHVARMPSSLASITRQALLSDIDDATYPHNSTILSGNISGIDIQPALPQLPATTTNEASILVNSDAGGANYNSYLFRWRQILSTPFEAVDVAEGQVLERVGFYTGSSQIASARPYSVTIGNGGSIAADNTNTMLPILKVNSTGAVEFGLLNTDIETIHSTTRDSSGFFRPALVR